MNVFIFRYNGLYGGGCAIVIAYTAIEAYQLLKEEMYPYDIEEYTDLDHYVVEKRLSTNYHRPSVITCAFYNE